MIAYLVLQEAVIKALADKVPKVVVAAVDVLTTALRYNTSSLCSISMPSQRCC